MLGLEFGMGMGMRMGILGIYGGHGGRGEA